MADKRKGKPSAKQLAARKKFAKIMKSGGFKKKSKVKKGSRVKKKIRTVRVTKPSKTKRSRGGSASDVNKTLLLNDINRLKTSKKNKLKIVKSIAVRLGI